MKQICSFFSIAVVVSAMLSCDKPHQHLIQSDTISATAAVFATSLADSLPLKTFEAINVGKVTGTKIVNLEGLDVRYFEYEADPDVLLNALAESPFELESKVADTTCRRINHQDLLSSFSDISDAERAYAASFMNKDPEHFEYYACVKSPIVHLVALNRSTRKVFHCMARQI